MCRLRRGIQDRPTGTTPIIFGALSPVYRSQIWFLHVPDTDTDSAKSKTRPDRPSEPAQQETNKMKGRTFVVDYLLKILAIDNDNELYFQIHI